MINKLKSLVLKNFTKEYWKSSKSNSWHKQRKNDSQDDFEIFSNFVSKRITTFNSNIVLEVGTASGSLIYLLSSKVKDNTNFIGIDINKTQIKENNILFKDITNLQFVYGDVHKYLCNNNFKDLVILAQNTFDYFHSNDLKELFTYILVNIDNASIIISSNLKNNDLDESIDRIDANLKVYSHNYVKLLKNVGFKLVEFEIMDEKKNIMIVAHNK